MAQNCCGNRDSHYNCALSRSESYPSIGFYVPLAQLDRASGYEPEGRAFESLTGRIISLASLESVPRFVRTRCDSSLELCYRTLLYRYKKARKKQAKRLYAILYLLSSTPSGGDFHTIAE